MIDVGIPGDVDRQFLKEKELNGVLFDRWMKNNIEGYVGWRRVDGLITYQFDNEENANMFKMRYLTYRGSRRTKDQS